MTRQHPCYATIRTLRPSTISAAGDGDLFGSSATKRAQKNKERQEANSFSQRVCAIQSAWTGLIANAAESQRRRQIGAALVTSQTTLQWDHSISPQQYRRLSSLTARNASVSHKYRTLRRKSRSVLRCTLYSCARARSDPLHSSVASDFHSRTALTRR